MRTLCELLEPFVDGELSAEDAEAFRRHLLECPSCKRKLEELLQLEQLGMRYIEKRSVPAPAMAGPRRLRSRRVAAYALAGVVALVLVLVVARPWTAPPAVGGRAPQVALWKPQAKRRLEARTSYPGSDVYRGLEPQSMGPGDAPTQSTPYDVLGQFERAEDHRGLAAALLAEDRKDLGAQAREQLAKVERTPDVMSDEAAAWLVERQPAKALEVLERALVRSPRHPQALWNHALALAELNLPLSAARGFEEVAALNEPGWADEARARAKALRSSAESARAQWAGALEAGKVLAREGTIPPRDVRAAHPPSLRLYFYDAVRTRTSPEDVRALAPLARELDIEAGGDILVRYVQWVERRDFARRRPLAMKYDQLRRRVLAVPEAAKVISELARSGEDDLALGAILFSPRDAASIQEFEVRAGRLGDPWFSLLAAHLRAEEARKRDDLATAERVLDEALGHCAAPFAFRCIELEADRADIANVRLELDAARAHAERGLSQARTLNEYGPILPLTESLAETARLRNDVPLSRAYLQEALELLGQEPAEGTAELAERKIAHEQYIRQNLAQLELYALDFEAARQEIDHALALGKPLTLNGALALADIARRRPSKGDEEAIAGAKLQQDSAGVRALLKEALGRVTVERDRERGRRLLREAIGQATSSPEVAREESARRAKAYAYTALILDYAKAEEPEGALRLFGEELGADVPEHCVLALTADTERALFLARGADGRLLPRYDGNRSERPKEDAKDFVPPDIVAALRGCDAVQVWARPPFHGQAGLLPPELPWSYRVRVHPLAAPAGPPVHVVIKDVELSRQRREVLKPLQPWHEELSGETTRVIDGPRATPSRVLREIEDATEIDLVTHGVLSDASSASYLVLAPEGERDELRAADIPSVHLWRAPLVVLAACRAAHASPSLHERAGLPSAFLEAGARAVIAATEELPQREAEDFFNALRQRIRRGKAPAVALQEVRMETLRASPGNGWAQSILLFE